MDDPSSSSSEPLHSSDEADSVEDSVNEPHDADGDGEDDAEPQPRRAVKVPRLEEIREIRAAALNVKAAFAQLDLDALLSLRSKLTGSEGLKGRLFSMKKALEALEDRVITVDMAKSRFPRYRFADPAASLSFSRPASVHVVGSLVLGTMCTTNENVDIAVEMTVRYAATRLDAVRPDSQQTASPSGRRTRRTGLTTIGECCS
jgi:hypothetical protein